MANGGMKRSIKFDDENYSLMLDIQLPGLEWRRIRPHQARAARRADPSLQSGPSELSLDMIAGAVRGHDHSLMSSDSSSGVSAIMGTANPPP